MKFIDFRPLGKLTILIAFAACHKGDFVPSKKYMKLNIDAFYTDSSYYSIVQLDGEVIAENNSSTTGYVHLASKELDAPDGDSGHIKLTVIKTNGETLYSDTTLHFTNNNNFLLVQLDHNTTPVWINKNIETSSLIKPGEDSVKIRFFFNASDSIRYPEDYPTVSFRGRVVDSCNIQLYSLAANQNSEYEEVNIKKENIITGVKANVLNGYWSVCTHGSVSGTVFGVDIVDIKSSRIIQKYQIGRYNGFTKGNLELSTRDNGLFQTYRLSKNTILDYDTYEDVVGFNSLFQFGLN